MKVLLPVRVLPSAYCSPGGHIICRCQYLGPYNCNGPILHSIGFAKEVEEANDQIYSFQYLPISKYSVVFIRNIFYLRIPDISCYYSKQSSPFSLTAFPIQHWVVSTGNCDVMQSSLNNIREYPGAVPSRGQSLVSNDWLPASITYHYTGATNFSQSALGTLSDSHLYSQYL